MFSYRLTPNLQIKKIITLVIILHVLFFNNSFAQKNFYKDNSIKVFIGSYEKKWAWCAGFNSPQINLADLNNDGLKDLVVFESGKGVKTFINKGVAGSPNYVYQPVYENNFPPLSNYLILADYNCDNIPDLFHGGSTGYAVYTGYYNTFNRLSFNFYKDLYYFNDPSSSGAVNAFNNPGDIPAIVDVDFDGDLDFISYNIIGGFLNYYKNLRVEDGLPCDSIRIALKDRCWGKVYQGFFRTHLLGYSCDNTGLRSSDTAGKLTHSGNTPCLFDWDMDGDYDYLDGSVSFSEMTFLKNGRIEYGGKDSMVYQDTTWQSGGTVINIPTWPAAFNVDFDDDGKKDLLVSPNSPSGSENYKTVWFYKNYTTPGSPDWRFQSDSIFTKETIDIGTAAYPALFDFNKDGKLDLFIGSDGYYQTSGVLKSKLSYYKNTTTTGNPSLTSITDNFLFLDTFNFTGIAPSFGDIDNDGKSDLILGHTDGSLSYFKNIASSETLAPNWVLQQLQLTDINGDTILTEGRSAPFIYDIDRDGKKDLIIGNVRGSIYYYQNVSTSSGAIALKLVTTSLGNIRSDPNQIYGCYSTPFVGKIDSTGTDYLILGSNSGNLYLFDGITSGDTTLTYTLIDGQFAYVDSTYSLYNHPSSIWGRYSGQRSAATIGDIDGDGDLEMIVGNYRGGVSLFKRKIFDDTNIEYWNTINNIKIYPVPARSELNIVWNNKLSTPGKVKVLNLLGQVVYEIDTQPNIQNITISVSEFSNGIYMCIFESAGVRIQSKFTVLR